MPRRRGAYNFVANLAESRLLLRDGSIMDRGWVSPLSQENCLTGSLRRLLEQCII